MLLQTFPKTSIADPTFERLPTVTGVRVRGLGITPGLTSALPSQILWTMR